MGPLLNDDLDFASYFRGLSPSGPPLHFNAKQYSMLGRGAQPPKKFSPEMPCQSHAQVTQGIDISAQTTSLTTSLTTSPADCVPVALISCVPNVTPIILPHNDRKRSQKRGEVLSTLDEGPKVRDGEGQTNRC